VPAWGRLKPARILFRKIFDAADVCAGGGRQIGHGFGSVDLFGPTLVFFIDRLAFVKNGLVGRKFVVNLALVFVADAYFDRRNAGQDIELGQDDVAEAVYSSCVSQYNRIEPAASTAAAGGGAVFGADFGAYACRPHLRVPSGTDRNRPG